VVVDEVVKYIPPPPENSEAERWSSTDGTLIAIRKVVPPDLQRAVSLIWIGTRARRG
jgi:hypothetical protein